MQQDSTPAHCARQMIELLQRETSKFISAELGPLNSPDLNPLIATLKPQSNGPSYNNLGIGTLAVDGWAVTFGTARRGLQGGTAARPAPYSLYQM